MDISLSLEYILEIIVKTHLSQHRNFKLLQIKGHALFQGGILTKQQKYIDEVLKIFFSGTNYNQIWHKADEEVEENSIFFSNMDHLFFIIKEILFHFSLLINVMVYFFLLSNQIFTWQKYIWIGFRLLQLKQMRQQNSHPSSKYQNRKLLYRFENSFQCVITTCLSNIIDSKLNSIQQKINNAFSVLNVNTKI